MLVLPTIIIGGNNTHSPLLEFDAYHGMFWINASLSIVKRNKFVPGRIKPIKRLKSSASRLLNSSSLSESKIKTNGNRLSFNPKRSQISNSSGSSVVKQILGFSRIFLMYLVRSLGFENPLTAKIPFISSILSFLK